MQEQSSEKEERKKAPLNTFILSWVWLLRKSNAKQEGTTYEGEESSRLVAHLSHMWNCEM